MSSLCVTSDASYGIPDELMARLKPVWLNTYWVKNALGLCEGIWKHGDKLQQHQHFFGLVHNFTVSAAVFGICKLFDRSNRRHDKDTIPDLFDYMKAHFSDAYASRLDTKTLIDLDVSDVAATRIVSGFKKSSIFPETKQLLLQIVEPLMPTCDNRATLAQLFTVRDKFIAHQERMCLSVREQCEGLPSLDEMEKLNNWACTFCQLTCCIMANETCLPHAVHARMAALNVVAKVLGKNFDDPSDTDYQGREAFYKRFP
jgi:hypothetical protein